MYGVASSDSVLGPARNYNGLSLSQGHVGAMSWYVIVEFSDHFQAYLKFFFLQSVKKKLHHIHQNPAYWYSKVDIK